VAEPKFRVEGATKVYETKSGPVHALEDFSMDVREGELVCILGPSGCGKTTLLWAMSGLHALTDGRVLLNGTPVNGPRPQEIGIIFQEANLLPWRNLRQNIAFPFEIKKRPPDAARIQTLLRETGLEDFAGSMPRELSGGMQQRASLSRALLLDPPLLLMDEPFGALDAMTRDDLNLELLRVWGESLAERKTIVFVTHSIPEAVFLADRVAVLSQRPGQVTATFEIPLPRPRTPATRALPEFGRLALAIHDALAQQVER
jgi:NitT/TauT family transport system ATP-binding protein